MTKFTKLLSAFLIAGLIGTGAAVGLTGCGNNENNGANTEQGSGNEQGGGDSSGYSPVEIGNGEEVTEQQWRVAIQATEALDNYTAQIKYIDDIKYKGVYNNANPYRLESTYISINDSDHKYYYEYACKEVEGDGKFTGITNTTKKTYREGSDFWEYKEQKFKTDYPGEIGDNNVEGKWVYKNSIDVMQAFCSELFYAFEQIYVCDTDKSEMPALADSYALFTYNSSSGRYVYTGTYTGDSGIDDIAIETFTWTFEIVFKDGLIIGYNLDWLYKNEMCDNNIKASGALSNINVNTVTIDSALKAELDALKP